MRNLPCVPLHTELLGSVYGFGDKRVEGVRLVVYTRSHVEYTLPTWLYENNNEFTLGCRINNCARALYDSVHMANGTLSRTRRA